MSESIGTRHASMMDIPFIVARLLFANLEVKTVGLLGLPAFSWNVDVFASRVFSLFEWQA